MYLDETFGFWGECEEKRERFEGIFQLIPSTNKIYTIRMNKTYYISTQIQQKHFGLSISIHVTKPLIKQQNHNILLK